MIKGTTVCILLITIVSIVLCMKIITVTGTIKPAHVVDFIKQSSVLKGHFFLLWTENFI
jgi:hypothetical protein